MKNKVLVMLLIFTIVCMLFAFVACKDPNETPSGDIPSGEVGSGEQNPPSGEISSGDNNQGDDNDQSGNEDTIEKLIPAYENFKGEEIDYSLYFKTDGNGKIIGLSDYAIEKREEIIQLEIPEKIGDEDITALSITFESLPYLRSLIIPDNIQIIEKPINQRNFANFIVIYCEANIKPDGWLDEWNCDDSGSADYNTVVWDCENNNVAANGKIYCFSKDGALYALKDNEAELVFSGISYVEELEIASILNYRKQTYHIKQISFLSFSSICFNENGGSKIFQNNDNLRNLIIPEGVTNIDIGAFEYCTNIINIKMPSSVTSIGYGAFWGCSSLTSIEIPSGVTSIGKYAFLGCRSLTSIEIPDSVTSIGNETFSGCNSLSSIEIPSSVTSIGDSAFSYCSSLTSIEIPSSVTSIGDSAFSWCSSLTSIEIPSSVTSIGNSAFSGCSSLTSIEIPDSVTSIGNEAFSGCSSLSSIEIPSSVTSIGSYAFQYCSHLTSIEIPSSVTSIGNGIFAYCSSLTNVTFENTSGWYYTEDTSATSGTEIDVTNPSLNAINLTSTYLYYWKRNV